MKHFKMVILFMVFACLGVCPVSAGITSAEALSKFNAAGEEYKAGQYGPAIDLYNEILSGGYESGALYYNLGNSYFRQGEIGRAILNYERARRLMPRDSDLNFNMHYARTRTGRVDQSGQNFFHQAIQAHIYFYTMDEMVIISVALIAAMGVVVLMALYWRWPKSISRSVMIGFLCVLVVFSLGIIFKAEYERDLAVAIHSTESYFEPREDSTVHFKINEGMYAEILKSSGSWIKIKRMDGKIGWVAADALEDI